eukprot:11649374-Alexandrium_andersonii.AAC.1
MRTPHAWGIAGDGRRTHCASSAMPRACNLGSGTKRRGSPGGRGHARMRVRLSALSLIHI